MQESVALNPQNSQIQVDRLDALYRLTDRLYRAHSLSDVFDAALDAVTATLGCRRASILLFDAAGTMDFVAWRGLSEGYRHAVRGHSPWTPDDRDAQPIYVVDIDETDEAEAIKAAVRGENIRGLAFIPLMAHGAVIGKFMAYYESPRIFADYERDLAITIARQVGFAIERARAEEARRKFEADLRESEGRFRLMSEHAPVMIWMSDASGRCLHLNRMLREFWGVAEDEVDTFDWRVTMHPDDADRIGRDMWDALIRRAAVALHGRYRNADGEYRILQTDARPRFSPDGEFLGMLGVNIDVTARERADAQRELLLAELNHRVKNTLAVVQAIAHQTFRGEAARAEAQAFEGRLLALAAAHNHLTQAHWENASLEEIVADTLQSRGENKERVRVSGGKVLLKPKAAVAIAMALHELGVNALKYGALSNGEGKVELAWAPAGEGSETGGALRLVWRERDGPAVAAPTRRGFGSLLLQRTLAQDLGGKVDLVYRADGVHCVIDIPVTLVSALP